MPVLWYVCIQLLYLGAALQFYFICLYVCIFDFNSVACISYLLIFFLISIYYYSSHFGIVFLVLYVYLKTQRQKIDGSIDRVETAHCNCTYSSILFVSVPWQAHDPRGVGRNMLFFYSQ